MLLRGQRHSLVDRQEPPIATPPDQEHLPWVLSVVPALPVISGETVVAVTDVTVPSDMRTTRRLLSASRVG